MNRREKEIEILQTAIRCIGRYGLEKTNAQLVSEKLGIAQSGVFYYFPKREDLFHALVGYLVEVNHGLVEGLVQKRKPQTYLSRLKTHLEGNLLWAKKYPDQVAVLLFAVSKTSHSSFLRDLMNRLFLVGEERIYGYLVAGLAENEFEMPVSAREKASLLHKLLMGFIVGDYYARKMKIPVSHYETLFLQVLPASRPKKNLGSSQSEPLISCDA